MFMRGPASCSIVCFSFAHPYTRSISRRIGRTSRIRTVGIFTQSPRVFEFDLWTRPPVSCRTWWLNTRFFYSLVRRFSHVQSVSWSGGWRLYRHRWCFVVRRKTNCPSGFNIEDGSGRHMYTFVAEEMSSGILRTSRSFRTLQKRQVRV